ncbi:MAG: hypothetical protein GX442_26110 [Candidatus Riflebacteria bacterium]|nr:hypothetical protein [Candidatus Riflebacteria bacterium]
MRSGPGSMGRRLLLAGFLLLLLAGTAGLAGADQFRYEFPRSLVMALHVGPASGTMDLEAVLESRLGTLSGLELSIETSPDWRCDPPSARIPTLTEGRIQRFPLTLAPTGARPDELGSWVRLGVKFSPDYPRMLATVSDPVAFPDENERRRLVETATLNQKSRVRFTDATRLFLPAPR